jgi:diamine N-acetyltransferase
MVATIELREITGETVRQVTALAVAPDQEGYVAPNAVSIAEAYFEPKAWFRAIAAGEELVGFAMVYRDPQAGEFYVWRFMIDARHQGHGYGRRAVELLVEEARRDGVEKVTLSVVPGDRSALEFYKRLGFVETGNVHGKEIELALPLST